MPPLKDHASAEVVGVVLCVGLAVMVFGVALWVAAWCPTCEDHAEGGLFSAAWAGEGQPHMVTGPGGEVMECRPILYVHNGYARVTGGETCGLVSVKLDPSLPGVVR